MAAQTENDSHCIDARQILSRQRTHPAYYRQRYHHYHFLKYSAQKTIMGNRLDALASTETRVISEVGMLGLSAAGSSY